jgi:hypothetical protein
MENVTAVDRQLQDEPILALQQARLSNYQLHVGITQALDEGAKTGNSADPRHSTRLAVSLPASSHFPRRCTEADWAR